MINYEYFNNLNEDEYYVRPHTYLHTQLKKSRILHTQSMWRFPVEMGTSSSNTYKNKFICHL